ncbi:helix-turn-helix domain-containing protein [Hydrogenophaga sp.]|uniref:helix-turn-helix domain-containing protein n=1 Tax=Hydrogenophaga sp. TaxID=1904254 RepID=UPI003F72116D
MSDVQNAVETAGRPVLLRSARESAGLHIAALAAALKVPVRKLEALEAGRYNELPDLTFARALASSACRHLKIDPAPILEQIPQGVAPELGHSRHAINAPFKPASDPAPVNPLSWLSRPAMLAAIVLLLGALVIVFLPRAQDPPAAAGGDTVVTPVEPVAAEEPVAATVAVEPAAEPTTGVPSLVTPPPPVPETAPAPTSPVPNAATTPAPTVAATTGSLLTIAATGESWVEVTNGAGSVVIQRMLKAGDAVDFSSSPPYTVVLGRAESAQVTVRGRPFDVNAIARNNVARFEVK